MYHVALLLALGVSGPAYAEAVKLLEHSNLFKEDSVDFNSFLLLYGRATGLSTTEAHHTGENKLIWIPRSGAWELVISHAAFLVHLEIILYVSRSIQ